VEQAIAGGWEDSAGDVASVLDFPGLRKRIGQFFFAALLVCLHRPRAGCIPGLPEAIFTVIHFWDYLLYTFGVAAQPSIPRAVIVCAAFLAALCVRAAPQTKERAPRFNAKTMDGELFTNQTIKGKVVLLEFWTTWCPYCFTEAPYVDKLSKEFGGQGLLVLTINVGESKKTVKKYLGDHPRTTRVVLTDDTNLAAMYEAVEYPIYVVIDRDGYIAATQRGAAGEAALREMLATAGISPKPQPDSTN
jgi:thiol-disulfide isomerase/thioredoxin